MGTRAALLPDRLVSEVVDRIRTAEAAAGVVAVLLRGSHARGTADVHSDLDVTAVTRSQPAEPYRTWFADRTDLLPLHVSAGARSFAHWLESGRRPAEWALGLPAIDEARYLWQDSEAAGLLGDPPSRRHPAAGPELEDFVEATIKAARAARLGDTASLRVHARIAAELAPRLLAGVAAAPPARDRQDALHLALELRGAPQGYRDDMTLCLGLGCAETSTLTRAAERLAGRLLEFLRTHNAEVDPQPGVAEALSSGAFERHVAAAFGTAPGVSGGRAPARAPDPCPRA